MVRRSRHSSFTGRGGRVAAGISICRPRERGEGNSLVSIIGRLGLSTTEAREREKLTRE